MVTRDGETPVDSIEFPAGLPPEDANYPAGPLRGRKKKRKHAPGAAPDADGDDADGERNGTVSG